MQHILSFYEGVGVGDLKIEEWEWEVSCIDFTALSLTKIKLCCSCLPCTCLFPFVMKYEPVNAHTAVLFNWPYAQLFGN
jgi:hypothetical protein